jgi:guanylate kinase
MSDTVAVEPSSPAIASGRLFIVSAPSGAGKTTLCDALRSRFGDLAYSISYTTRSPRRGERDGKDYFFISQEAFEQGIAEGRWAEWARVHGYLYGTSAEWIAQTLAQGKDILMDIDVQGTRQLLQRFPQAVTIFIRPPSIETLEKRLRQRGADDAATIAIRLKNARSEMDQQNIYRHVLINEDLDKAKREFIAIIESYRLPT